MDEADIAFEFEQRNLSHAIATQRMAAAQVAATGRCLNCEEEVAGQKLFCDEHCKHDWERAEGIRRKLGIARAPHVARQASQASAPAL